MTAFFRDRPFGAGHILRTVAFFLIPVAVSAPRGLSVLAALGGVAVVGFAISRRTAVPFPLGPAVYELGALAVLMVSSALWSVDPGLSLVKALPAVGTMLASLVMIGAAQRLDQAQTQAVRAWFLAGGAAGLVFVAIEILTDSAFHRWVLQDSLLHVPPLRDPVAATFPLNRGMSVLSIGVWLLVLTGLASGRRRFGVALFIAGAGALVYSDNLAPPLALMVGMACAGLVLVAYRWALRGLGAALVGLILIAPAVPHVLPIAETAAYEHPYLPPSAVQRLKIWSVVAEKIAERPVLGWGFDSSRTFSSREDQTSRLIERRPDGSLFIDVTEDIPLHPHNAILQWWLELGFLGAAVGAFIVGALFRTLLTLPRLPAALATGMVLSATTNLAISYGAWQNWWLSAMALVAMMAAALLVAPSPPKPD